MKSHSSDKKHAKADHKSNHKSAPKDHKDHKEKDHKEKAHKAEQKGEHKADKHAAKPHPEAEKQGKGMKKEKGKAVATAVPAAVHVVTEKPTRLAMIKQRHEAMKREIDQIREDLESDEDE